MNEIASDEFRNSFFQECDELLETMHDGFTFMAENPDDSETIHAVFRAVHSIKGGAGAFGLDALVGFAHRFETGLDAVRAGKVEVEPALLDLFQRCGDHLSDQVAAARGECAIEDEQTTALYDSLTEMTGASGPEEDAALPDFEPAMLDFDAFDLPEMATDTAVPGLRVQVASEPELFSSGNEIAVLFRALDRLGPLSVSADCDAVPPLADLDPGVPAMTWSIEFADAQDEAAIRDVFEFVSDCCHLTMAPHGMPDAPVIMDHDVSPETPDPQPSAAPDGLPSAGVADQDLRPPAAKPSGQDAPAKGRATSTIRVDLDRVDKLINLVGELVIKEAMLSQSVTALALSPESDVAAGLDSLKQLASEIQEGVMAIRAQPVKPIFQRMARTVRDASLATGKRVRLVTRGEYTEVDKTVLERLVDPLTHMIRNAVDHGLEDAATRAATGKAEDGTITLSAAHRSGRVLIEITDDGAGINRTRVREIAEAKGLVAAEAELTPSEIDNLLFMPGFSSKEEISELSGRGVGLDVARSEILALGGRLSIQSEPGRGTTFSISLPLTLAVLEGMVVGVAGQTMIVPISAIKETLQLKSATLHTIGSGARVLATRDGLVPVIDLGSAFRFHAASTDHDSRVLLVVETEAHRRCALLVDAIQDQRQVVIKSLETNYQRIDGIAAATILGDGRIALIIDPDSLVSDAFHHPPTITQSAPAIQEAPDARYC